jgi:hypothetical protein
MEIKPFYGDQPLGVSQVVIRVDSEDRSRVAKLVARSSKLEDVHDKTSFEAVRQIAGELKAATNEITDSKRAAKRPFEAVLAAIENLARDILAPVQSEQNRILGMLNSYVTELEDEQKREERKRKEQERLAREQAARRIAEALEAKRLAQEKERQARDELERERAQNERIRHELALAEARLEEQLDLEIALMNQEPPKALVADGRVDHRLRFRLLNPAETIKAGYGRLLRIELNILNCQDLCKAQLEMDPDNDPQLPGIEVSRETSVSVRATARIQ